jgi:predicted nucleic acid-binding protein
MRAVSDAGPLIHLSWIDQLPLLNHLFDEVIVPSAVRDEVLVLPPAGIAGLDVLERAFGRGDVLVSSTIDQVEADAYTGPLDAGEAEAIAEIFLTDDAHARRVASRRGLHVMGTLGILRSARERGLVRAVYPLVVELRRHGQWLGRGLVEAVRDEESLEPG